MRDAIIGSITNYTIDQIKPWVESLNRSGFDGDRFMVCYNIDYKSIDYLKTNNFKLKLFLDLPQQKMYTHIPQPNFHICVQRFFDMWEMLRNLKDYRYLISTDVGDVIFQSNPSIWLENNLGDYQINAASESVYYRDETLWGANNMLQSFGTSIFETVKDNLIYNAGTISGRFQTVVDTFLAIYNMCQGFRTRNPDQAAYNLLLSLEPYRSITRFTESETGWACQLGTTMNPSALKHLKIVEPKPVIIDETVCTSQGQPFVIVHQYNRIPELVELFKV